VRVVDQEGHALPGSLVSICSREESGKSVAMQVLVGASGEAKFDRMRAGTYPFVHICGDSRWNTKQPFSWCPRLEP
jgi:hypothetical protein